MPTKVNTTKKNTQRHRTGPKKDGTEISAPSAEGIPGVETEPTSEQETSSNTENVTPQTDALTGEFRQSLHSLASHFESIGLPPDIAARAAKIRMEDARNWALRLEKVCHFEKHEGLDEEGYHLLFNRGRNILVSAVDAARAATFVAGSGSKVEYTAAEIIGTLDVRDVVEVPGPEIPANLEGAVEGTYIPLELLLTSFGERKLGYDGSNLAILLGEFEDKQEHLRELRLREKRLRKARLEESVAKWYSLWREKLREKGREKRSLKAKLRRAKLRLEKQKP